MYFYTYMSNWNTTRINSFFIRHFTVIHSVILWLSVWQGFESKNCSIISEFLFPSICKDAILSTSNMLYWAINLITWKIKWFPPSLYIFLPRLFLSLTISLHHIFVFYVILPPSPILVFQTTTKVQQYDFFIFFLKKSQTFWR